MDIKLSWSFYDLICFFFELSWSFYELVQIKSVQRSSHSTFIPSCSGPSISRSASEKEFIIHFSLGFSTFRCQVPIEGEKEGGVEWVADQAAITVQELREVEK